jgi:hypothetical protein
MTCPVFPIKMKRVMALASVVATGFFQSCGGPPSVVVAQSEYLPAAHEAGEEKLYGVIRNKEQFDACLAKYHFKAIPPFVNAVEWGNDSVLLITSDTRVTSAVGMNEFLSFSEGMVVVRVVDEQEAGYGFAVLKGKVARYIKFTYERSPQHLPPTSAPKR